MIRSLKVFGFILLLGLLPDVASAFKGSACIKYGDPSGNNIPGWYFVKPLVHNFQSLALISAAGSKVSETLYDGSIRAPALDKAKVYSCKMDAGKLVSVPFFPYVDTIGIYKISNCVEMAEASCVE